jgi:Tol biopolymer transport system component
VGVLCGLVAGMVFSPSASARVGVPNPVVGPGGTTNGKIAFTSDRLGGSKQIWVMDADGKNQTPLTHTFAAADGASWSPDGTKIAFIGMDASHVSGVHVMNADGSGLRPLSGTWKRQNFDAPAWSPDGQQIAYTDPDRRSTIYVINSTSGIHVDDRGPRPLNLAWTQNRPGQFMNGPYWSPDGKRMVFKTFDPVGHMSIYVTNADGSGNPTKVITVGEGTAGGWFPGSTKIAYNGNGDVNVINADGTGDTNLTSSPQEDNDAAVSPDGQKIVFKSSFDIYTMNANGTGKTRLTTDAGKVGDPSWQPVNRGIDASVSEGVPPTILCGPGDSAWTAGKARVVCKPGTRAPLDVAFAEAR